jgi:hypothetical protein
MMKDFRMTEHFKLQFRADVFNLLNHPQFTNSSYDTNFSDVKSDGSIYGTAQTRLASERELQFALRVTF